MKPLLDKMSIAHGAPRDGQVACLALVTDALALDPGSPHTAVFEVGPAQALHLATIDVAPVGLAYLTRGPDRVVLLGERGEVHLFAAGGPAIEAIAGPVDRGPLRGLGVLAGVAFAVGANLQAYRRELDGVWQDVSPPPAMLDAYPRNHLEAVDGFAPDDVYAAGRQGVVWHFDGQRWEPIPTPTNLALTAICCAADGVVYACGQVGTLVAGRGSQFRVIESEGDLDDLWGICSLGERVHAASMRALFTLTDAGLVPCTPAMREASSFYSLKSSGGILWSFGAKDLLRSDGARWMRTDSVRVFRRPAVP